jgi:hypothetical protein
MKRASAGGNVIVLGCVLFSAVFLFSLLVLDMGRFCAAQRRAETIAQTTVLGSLRMRLDALRRVADRWAPIGDKLGPLDGAGRVFVKSVDVSSVRSAAIDLSHALSGYQGRASAIVTVLAQSNALPRERIVVADDTGSRLDIHAQPATVVDESGASESLAALWYQRNWAPAEDHPNPAGLVSHDIAFSLTPLTRGAAVWIARASASGQLRWNSSPDGNGGYPRDWNQTIVASKLNPHRTASYRAVLTDAP